MDKLHDAIAMVNQTGFGLTSGLESLDDREQAEWKDGIRAGNLLFLSGQVGFDPSTGSLVDGGITAQTEQVMRNIGTLLAAAGASFAHVVRTTVFLADIDEFAAMNAVYARHVVDPPPARSTVQVAAKKCARRDRCDCGDRIAADPKDPRRQGRVGAAL